MKKLKLNTEKLQLTKEKITSLSNSDLNKLIGGAGDSIGYSIGVRCSTVDCGQSYDLCSLGDACTGYTSNTCICVSVNVC